MDAPALREYATDAVRFWERGRILYNVVLTGVVATYFVAGYPSSKATLSINFLLGIFLLAVVANVAYCTAYIVDIFAQLSGFRDLWRRCRWLLFAVGTVFAAIITRFVAIGMFHPGD